MAGLSPIPDAPYNKEMLEIWNDELWIEFRSFLEEFFICVEKANLGINVFSEKDSFIL